MSTELKWTTPHGVFCYYLLDTPGDASTIKAEAGNYVFIKWTAQGWYPVYVGQAENLKARIPNHERWSDAAREGATRVAAHIQANTNLRLAEERAMIAACNPPCNTQHKVAGLASLLLSGAISSR